jgi:hypothetical protein
MTVRTNLARVVVALSLTAAPLHAQATPYPAAPAERCTSASGDASAALARAWHGVGLDRLGARIAHSTATDVVQQDYQSDRPYPPFFSMTMSRERWLDVRSGVERSISRFGGLGAGGSPATTMLSNERASLFIRDTLVRPLAALFAGSIGTRAMDIWATLADWHAAHDVRVVARCIYHEYPRLVLQRLGVYGPERLYLDEKSGMPVKLDREEPHYLWGQVRSEFVYQTWTSIAELTRPGAVFHLVDGAVEMERVDGSFTLVPADSAPSLAMAPTAPMRAELPGFLQALPVDTQRVGGEMRVLRNRGYGHGIVMLRDTVYLLDATQGDARGRLDSAWIAQLYPRHRAVAVVVTDLAWPHVAGVRYWVSRGATIVSHANSRPMLERVVARRWTRAPDALELARTRKTVPLNFVGVKDSLSLAGGALRLYPIDGIASEGALMAWTPGDRSLWASDFLQTTSEPSEYAVELARATKRAGIVPATVAAEHLTPTAWTIVLALVSAIL